MIDVLILGAGIAGLTLASGLERNGREVVVCEARNRIGGRAYSPQIGGHAFDLGASGIWDGEHAVLRLMKELGIQTYLSHEVGLGLFQDVRQVLPIQMPKPPFHENRVVGGTAAIAQALAAQVSNIYFKKPARRIRSDQHGLDVDFDDQTVRAKHVVVAFPPALLGTSVEVPELPQKLLGAYKSTPVWMGEIAKFVAIYDSPFWRDKGLSGLGFSHVGPMVEVHDMSGRDPHVAAALFGFVPRVRATGDWQTAAIDQFVELFGAQCRKPRNALAVEWWNEKYTFPAQKADFNQELFGHPVLRKSQLGGRLHLCSTETSAVNTGHINGAVHRALELAEMLS